MNFNPNSLFNFPFFTSWKEIHLGSLAYGLVPQNCESSLMLDSIFCQAWVEHIARKNKVNHTYGGYLENRELLWRGSYLSPEKCIHLGIDFNVPAGTIVYCPVPFTVLDIFLDNDQNGGWGGRILVGTKKGLVIFAHIDLGYFEVDKEYPAQSFIGKVADSHSNGGWYPHLHVQGLRGSEQIKGLDGYSHFYPEMREDYPNPLEFLTP